MRKCLCLLGLLTLALIVGSFLSPAVQLVRASNAVSAAETELQDAEREATPAAREAEIRPACRAEFEQATELVRARMAACQAARKNREEAVRRLNERFS